MEKEVLAIYVATSGALDSIPVSEVRRFEKEFLQFAETNYASLLKEIAAKKALDGGIKGDIMTALDAFKDRFASTIAAGAN